MTMLRRWILASIAAVFAAVSLGLPSDADAARVLRGKAGGGGGAQPYTYYPSFDKTLFPPQTAAGVWGPQSTIKEAALPTGSMTDVTVTTMGELQAQIYTANRRITVSGVLGIDGDANTTFLNAGNMADVDIIVPAGSALINIWFGSAASNCNTTIDRMRFRGTTVGDISTAGQLHRLRFFCARDLVIDALHLSGPGGNRGAISTDFASTRLAVTRNQVNSGGWFYIGTSCDATFTGNSVQTGMDTVTPAEGWGIRFSHEACGNLVVYGNDIRSNPARVNNSHHRVRAHPDPGLDYIWVYNNTLVDRVESRILWVDAAAGTGTGDARATWIDTNLVIAASCCGVPPGIEGGDQTYAYAINLTFQSDTFLSDTNIALNGITLTTKTGNTYAGLPGSDPAWGAAGDPTGIDWTP